MRAIRALRPLPISYRVPLIVALLMVVISAVMSERVLDRLSRTQEAFLDTLASTYLDGLSTAILPAALRADVWEVFDALDRSAASYEALSPLETVVTDSDGRVLAASNPQQFPSYSLLPDAYEDRYSGRFVTISEDDLTARAQRDLLYKGQPVGTIHAAFDVSHLFAERRRVLVTLLITNAILAGFFALAGFLLVRRMIAPMRVLEFHMRKATQGRAEPIAPHLFPSQEGEVARLFRGYNALVDAERERAELAVRLANEEKLASLGRLASGMAHEINNPLGGLFNVLDTLKKHGACTKVRETSLNLIERGLLGIREVVEATLASYRPSRPTVPLTAADLDDVRLLLRPELRRRKQHLAWNVEWPEVSDLSIPGGPVRQATLNLLLNASAATPEGGRLAFKARAADGQLELRIADQGSGLPPEAAATLLSGDVGAPVRTENGLGLWMVRRLVDELGGRIVLETNADGGATVTLSLPLVREGAKRDAA